MLAYLPGPLKGLLCGIFLLVNTVAWTVALLPLAVLKACVPHRGFRRLATHAIVGIAEIWTTFNNLNLALTQKIRWHVTGLEGLSREKSYLVCANHQSWVDIIVLQKVFNRRIPFLRFFLKQELIYIPLLGIAWWALDYPFMKRYSKEYLERHPEKRGQDLETTRRSCERFRGSRITVINFLEGTRFTAKKHAAQASPYRHLLKPKAGGVAFVLECMGEQFDSLVDVTIHYPKGTPTFVGLITGKMPEVIVLVRRLAIPRDLLGGRYLEDESFRDRVQAWVRELWELKDRRLDEL